MKVKREVEIACIIKKETHFWKEMGKTEKEAATSLENSSSILNKDHFRLLEAILSDDVKVIYRLS